MPTNRQLRSDAVRNRKRIVRAARRGLAIHGPEVQMAQIASLAGVAVGTLYRNFPTKAHLVEAVVKDLSDTLLDDMERTASRIETGAPARDELLALATRGLEAVASGFLAATAVRALDSAGDVDTSRRYRQALDRLVKVGLKEGALRPDATADDIRLVVLTVPADQSAEARARWLRIVLDGMTAGT